MDCTGKIFKNILRECDYKPKQGLDSTMYIMNTSEIDRQATQLSASKLMITNLVLKSGGHLFQVDGEGKYPQGAVELVKGDNGNGWKHKLTMRISYYGEVERQQIQEMVKNGRITAIIKKVDTGKNGELTYEVLGFESGMTIQTVTWSSAENGGVVAIELATDEGEEEATDRKIFLSNTVAETEAYISKSVLKEAAPPAPPAA